MKYKNIKEGFAKLEKEGIINNDTEITFIFYTEEDIFGINEILSEEVKNCLDIDFNNIEYTKDKSELDFKLE